MAYLAFTTTFRDLSNAPSSYIDFVEQDQPGWGDKQLALLSSLIDAKLAKRYATPFDSASPPAPILDWLARLMTLRTYLKRGIDPTDAQVSEIKADAQAAWLEILDAANSKDGLTELPLRADSPGSDGVTRATPLSYSEAGPYQWSPIQEQAAFEQSGESTDFFLGGIIP